MPTVRHLTRAPCRHRRPAGRSGLGLPGRGEKFVVATTMTAAREGPSVGAMAPNPRKRFEMGKSERRSRARALFGAAPSALAFKFFAGDDIGPVKASNGYHATVSTGGRRQRERGPQPDSPGGNADYYSTSATVSAKAVKAQFGDAPELGSIRMAFHVKKKKRIDHAGVCKGKATTEKLGAWKGTLTFTGEGGYTHLSVAKAL